MTVIPAPTHRSASWLPLDTSAIVRGIIEGALADVLVCEEPLGSNRGACIDLWNKAAGVPAGSFWCASWAASVWRRAGAQLPPFPAACDDWMRWAKRYGHWDTHPSYGAAVLYGVPGDARHIGIVVRLTPFVGSIEGNATVEGSQFERNGTAVAVKLVTPHDPVLGYVRPVVKGAP